MQWKGVGEMEEKQGINYLRKKSELYRLGALKRNKYYNAKDIEINKGITIPLELRAMYRTSLGWCGKAVDSIADRLVFRELANDNFGISEIFQMNSQDILIDDAILSALINSVSFIYISMGDEGMPRLQVISGADATGILDPTTRLLKEGYAVLSRNKYKQAKEELHFLPYRTDYYVDGKYVSSEHHKVAYPLLVPIIHRPDAEKPFGRSRITRSAMAHQKYAKRTIERSDVTAEFYSFPQKYVLGMDSDAEAWDNWKATVASMLRIDAGKDGKTPSVGQFSTSSMSPFTEQLRTAAALFAGETGLTLDDLGFVSDNPSSAEAIKASHETLRLQAEKAKRDFSSGILNTGYLAACLRDNYPYLRQSIFETEVKWEPIFKPDASTISLIGDGAIKINQAIPDYFGPNNLRDLTGIEGENNA